MYEIIQRKETLQQQILNEKDEKKKIYLLLESEFVNTLFYERHIQTHTMSQKVLNYLYLIPLKIKDLQIYYTLI